MRPTFSWTAVSQDLALHTATAWQAAYAVCALLFLLRDDFGGLVAHYVINQKLKLGRCRSIIASYCITSRTDSLLIRQLYFVPSARYSDCMQRTTRNGCHMRKSFPRKVDASMLRV